MTFRILCLDGGGIRGVMPARILEKIEEQLGGRLKDHFDLIAGTSTGSILAVGIALGKSPN
ncbi:patatin-like phospholipase family protein [Okeania sp. SIO3B5]|uniref:patatin-like phospholipase family protein n=1 Tax=Okeania sp. SIO3B5 TaxID=2607811 RepID=UPI0034542BAD